MGPIIAPRPNAPVVMAATDELSPDFIPDSIYSIISTSLTFKFAKAVRYIAAFVLLFINADPHPLIDNPTQITHIYCGKKLAGPWNAKAKESIIMPIYYIRPYFFPISLGFTNYNSTDVRVYVIVSRQKMKPIII